jgi:hypothetical protein
MSHQGASGEPDKHQPHVFVEVDLLPLATPTGPRGIGPMYAPPPTPPGKSVVCGVCHAPRADRTHIDGENAADAESPKWG